MGRSRQSVQQAADAMERDGFVGYAPNPHHRRARLVVPTPLALAALARLRPREIAFANQMGRQHSQAALDTMLDILPGGGRVHYRGDGLISGAQC
jgi:DNA-binding MarR family transcriptional regulator